MYTVLAWVILVTTGTFLGLTVIIVVNKAVREARELRIRVRRRTLEPRILAFVHGEQASIRDALDDAGEPRDRDVIERILLDNIQQVRGIERERMTAALEQLGYVDAWIERLESRRWWARAEAAEKLGVSRSARAAEGLAGALGDPTPEVRLRAAKGLGALGGEAAARVLIGALDEPNRWSTIRVADILTRMGRRVVDELIARFDSLQPTGKIAALDVLGRIRPLRSVPWLVERLDDEHRDIRARACHALGCIADPGTVPDLTRALGDRAWPVRAMAAKALGRIKSEEAIEALRRTLEDREWWVRHNAARALRACGAPGLRALERALDDDDRFARHQAVLMLQEAGVVDARIDELVHGDAGVRERAAAFVHRLIDAGQTDRLRTASREHTRTEVRAALRGMLPPEDAEVPA